MELHLWSCLISRTTVFWTLCVKVVDWAFNTEDSDVVCVSVMFAQVPLSTLIRTAEGCWFGLRITPSSTPNVSPLPVFYTQLLSSIRSSDRSELCVFSSSVDEYIAIAKEKHGYNVEQVGSSTEVSSFSQEHSISLLFVLLCLLWGMSQCNSNDWFVLSLFPFHYSISVIDVFVVKVTHSVTTSLRWYFEFKSFVKKRTKWTKLKMNLTKSFYKCRDSVF